MERAIHTRSGHSSKRAGRNLRYLGLLTLYGAAYSMVFYVFLGPFIAPLWFVLAWAGAGAGRRPTPGAIGALVSGFVLVYVTFESWRLLGCTGPGCGYSAPPSLDDLVWNIVGVAQLLAGAGVWWLLSRSDHNGELWRPGGWGRYAAALAPLMLVALPFAERIAAA